jgi:hypothetical protein
MDTDLMREEFRAWKDLCRQLLDTGAVTQADLAAATSATETPGQRLLVALRCWGGCHAAMLASAPPSSVDRWVTEVGRSMRGR